SSSGRRGRYGSVTRDMFAMTAKPALESKASLPPSGRRGARISEMRSLLRLALLYAAIGLPTSTAVYSAALAEQAPKRGGTLEFAVLVEPGNYDCHGNISFAFLHPIAPHYS